MFCESVVANVIFYAVVCWGSSMEVDDTNRQDNSIRSAGSVLVDLDPLSVVAERRMLGNNLSHPLILYWLLKGACLVRD